MSARYYAAVAFTEKRIGVSEPCESYSAAMQIHVDEDKRQALQSPRPLPGEPRVLLDLGSITNLTPREMRQLMLDDPAIAAIFQLGRRYERATTR